MTGFLGATFWFIVTLGVLVTFHEFGHFWVARRCGVQVLKFSVGFGRPLWSRIGRDGNDGCALAVHRNRNRKNAEKNFTQPPTESFASGW